MKHAYREVYRGEVTGFEDVLRLDVLVSDTSELGDQLRAALVPSAISRAIATSQRRPAPRVRTFLRQPCRRHPPFSASSGPWASRQRPRPLVGSIARLPIIRRRPLRIFQGTPASNQSNHANPPLIPTHNDKQKHTPFHATTPKLAQIPNAIDSTITFSGISYQRQ